MLIAALRQSAIAPVAVIRYTHHLCTHEQDSGIDLTVWRLRKSANSRRSRGHAKGRTSAAITFALAMG
jgi:hypothetical protein